MGRTVTPPRRRKESDLDRFFRESGLGDALIKKALWDVSPERTPIFTWMLNNEKKKKSKPVGGA